MGVLGLLEPSGLDLREEEKNLPLNITFLWFFSVVGRREGATTTEEEESVGGVGGGAEGELVPTAYWEGRVKRGVRESERE